MAPDVGEGRADQVVDERPDDREPWLPRHIDKAVQHALWKMIADRVKQDFRGGTYRILEKPYQIQFFATYNMKLHRK